MEMNGIHISYRKNEVIFDVEYKFFIDKIKEIYSNCIKYKESNHIKFQLGNNKCRIDFSYLDKKYINTYITIGVTYMSDIYTVDQIITIVQNNKLIKKYFKL